jgi:BlaI family penicillinase repressor
MPESMRELSRAEWLIMKACWDHPPRTAREVHEEVAPKREWEYQTVKTMLDRLVEKGYLQRKKVGPISVFSPAVPRTRVLRRAIDDFLETVLGNQLAPLLQHLSGSERLTGEDAALLKKLLEENREEKP